MSRQQGRRTYRKCDALDQCAIAGRPKINRRRAPGTGSSIDRHRVSADVIASMAAAALAFGLLDAPTAVFATLWWGAVLAVVRSDLDAFVIPDTATAAIAGLGLAQTFWAALAAGGSWRSAGIATAWAVATGSTAFGMFWMVGRAHRIARGCEGLGFGDVKLAGASALWLDAVGNAVALEIAALAAVVLVSLRSRRGPSGAIPFGAFLAPAAWLVFVTGPVFRAVVARNP